MASTADPGPRERFFQILLSNRGLRKSGLGAEPTRGRPLNRPSIRYSCRHSGLLPPALKMACKTACSSPGLQLPLDASWCGSEHMSGSETGCGDGEELGLEAAAEAGGLASFSERRERREEQKEEVQVSNRGLVLRPAGWEEPSTSRRTRHSHEPTLHTGHAGARLSRAPPPWQQQPGKQDPQEQGTRRTIQSLSTPAGSRSRWGCRQLWGSAAA